MLLKTNITKLSTNLHPKTTKLLKNITKLTIHPPPRTKAAISKPSIRHLKNFLTLHPQTHKSSTPCPNAPKTNLRTCFRPTPPTPSMPARPKSSNVASI